ncbi:hypothetical protein [Burkholderia ubonensis]|uniref:hypothetical protein n=1 Tax=Burkholderia ubonensis TaxID=101571 RepID=UPI0012F77A03|nr:hypothetical protein [Burkholderia ubonensis]
MPIMTVTAAIAGLKNTIDLVKAAVAARDDLKLAEMQQSINDRVIDIQNAALALQEKQSAARDEIDGLKEDLRVARSKLAELERARTESDKYVLHKVGQGRFAYTLKQDTNGSTVSGEPQHLICQSCFDGPEKRKVVLRYKAGGVVGRARFAPTWTCSVCGATIAE